MIHTETFLPFSVLKRMLMIATTMITMKIMIMIILNVLMVDVVLRDLEIPTNRTEKSTFKEREGLLIVYVAEKEENV